MSDAFSNGPSLDFGSSEKHEPVANKDVKPVKKQWGPLAAVLFSVFVYVILQYLVGFIILPVLMLQGKDLSKAETLLSGVHDQFLFYFVWAIIAIVTLGLFIKKYGQKLTDLGLTKLRWQYLWYGLAGVVTYYLLYIISVTLVSQLIPSLDLTQRQNLGFQAPSMPGEYVTAFIMLVILPPIVEELIFRGFMFKGFRSKLVFFPSAILTSVFFAIGHLQFGNGTPLLWVAGMDTFILSMVMCFVREKTNSLWPSMLMHGLKNLLAFILLYIVVV